MVATRKQQKKAEELRISQIGDFKNRLGGITELPSGLIVRLKNPGGLRAFMGSNDIPNSLMTLIQRGMKTGQKPSAEELMPNGEFDTAFLDDMNKMLDVIALRTIVEPSIAPRLTQEDVDRWNRVNPENPVTDIEDLRSPEQLYVDELPEDDKQFIFQWISGGTRDLEEFRRKQQQGVDDMAAVAVIRDPAQLDDGVNAG